MKKRFFSILVLLFLSAASLFAQTRPSAVPFKAGETLNYEIKVSRAIFRGISVAEMSFTLGEDLNNKNLVVDAGAKSKGTLTKLFRFSFIQNIKSTIDSEKFRALKTVKHDVQGERVRDSEAIFDYTQKMVTYVETDPKDPARPPRKIASAVPDETHDLISGVYHLRTLPLAVGKTFEVAVSDSGLVYKIPVRVTAKEMQNTAIGKVSCFRLEPTVFGPGRFIETKGSMIIWITDDARRLPVRSSINANIGKIEIKIKSVNNKL